MDETDFYDSDFEEIQLFTSANSVSPTDTNLDTNVCRAPEHVVEDVNGDSKNVEDVSKSKEQDQQDNDQKRVDLYFGKRLEVKERSLETNETGESCVSSKRFLENSSDLDIGNKKQKVTESVQIGTDESSKSTEGHEPYITKHNSENNQTGTSQEQKTKDETKNSKFDVKDSSRSPKCTKDSQTESCTKTKGLCAIDCPPIAIVSPLSGQKSSSMDSPQTELNLDKDEESALIAKVDDFDPSILEDFPCSIDEIVCSIFADKHDTFHTLDGNSWTFPDLQQIQTDEIKPHGSKENDNEKNDDQVNNLLKDVNSVIKQEPRDYLDQSQGCNKTDRDKLPCQSYAKDCTVKEEQREDECQQAKELGNQTPTMSYPVKGEQTFLDCPSQGKPFKDLLDRYSPSYSVSTDRITSPRQDPVNQKSGYQGLIRPGPPNRMMPDLRRQLGNLCAQGPPSRQQPNYPVLQSMIGNQGLHVQSQNHPNQYKGTSMVCPGVNKPNNMGTYLHPDRSTFYAGIQQYQPRHPTSMFPRQPNVNQTISAVPPRHPGNQFQMWGRNQSAQFPRTRPPSNVNGGFDLTIRNKNGLNIPQYPQHVRPQHVRPQHYINNPMTDNGLNVDLKQPGLGQFNLLDRGAVYPELEQSSNIQTPYHRNTCAIDNFVNPTVPRHNVSGHGTNQRQQMLPYPRSKHSPINNVFGQENVVSSQRSSPEQLISPPLIRGHNIQQASNSFPQVQQLLQSGQFGQCQRTPSPVIHNHGMPSVSKPWPSNQPKISNISMGTSANQLTGSFQGYNMNNVSHGPTLTQNESIPSIKQKLTEVIELSKSSRSQRVKTMVNYFVKRVVQVKQSVLSDAEKSNFIIETKNFIEGVTKLMNESCNQVPNNYVDNSIPKSSPSYNTEPPARYHSQTSNNTEFIDYIMPQDTNHGWSSQLQRQFMPETGGRDTTGRDAAVGVASSNPMMPYNSPQDNSIWLIDNVTNFDNIVVKNEPTHDINPLEKFIT